MTGVKFTHNLLTGYHCQQCYDKYKCKKPISDKKRNEREQESEQSKEKDIRPECKLCKINIGHVVKKRNVRMDVS